MWTPWLPFGAKMCGFTISLVSDVHPGRAPSALGYAPSPRFTGHPATTARVVPLAGTVSRKHRNHIAVGYRDLIVTLYIEACAEEAADSRGTGSARGRPDEFGQLSLSARKQGERILTTARRRCRSMKAVLLVSLASRRRLSVCQYC
jgi:hypothetical protein